MSTKHMRRVGLALGLAWACCWILFEGAEAMGDGQFGQAILFLVVMAGTVALAWKWSAIGGALFLLEGMTALVLFSPMWIRRFHPGEFLLLFAMMPAPPLAAGALLLLSRLKPHPAPSAGTA